MGSRPGVAPRCVSDRCLVTASGAIGGHTVSQRLGPDTGLRSGHRDRGPAVALTSDQWAYWRSDQWPAAWPYLHVATRQAQPHAPAETES